MRRALLVNNSLLRLSLSSTSESLTFAALSGAPADEVGQLVATFQKACGYRSSRFTISFGTDSRKHAKIELS
jgi:3-hydroxyisobutyrate dehydrogenase-like beta-hydroxyacid dehydrogenase